MTLKTLPKWLAATWGRKDIYHPYSTLTYPEELGCLTQDTSCNSVTLDSRSWSSSGLPWAIVWLKPSGRPLCDRLPALLRRFLSKSSGTVQWTECLRAVSVGMSRSKFRRQAAHLLTRLFVRRRCAEEEDNVTRGIIYTFSTWRIQWGSYATRRAVGFRVPFSFVSVQSQFGLLNLTLLK